MIVLELLVQVRDGLCRLLVLLFKHLLDPGRLLFVRVVGQLQVLGHIVVSGLLLNANLLSDLENFLLQVL